MTIQRYRMATDPEAERCDDGPWVRYEDAVSHVKTCAAYMESAMLLVEECEATAKRAIEGRDQAAGAMEIVHQLLQKLQGLDPNTSQVSMKDLGRMEVIVANATKMLSGDKQDVCNNDGQSGTEV